MHALITGGAGFIGSHLSEELLRRGDQVTIIDDLSTGSVENIEPLKGKPGFTYVFDTIHNHQVMAELVDEADVVYHLAAAVGVRLIIESPARTIETNIKGTELVLELAAKKGEGFEDMARRVPRLEKIRALIGYEPSMSLPRILAEVVEFHRPPLDPRRSAPEGHEGHRQRTPSGHGPRRERPGAPTRRRPEAVGGGRSEAGRLRKSWTKRRPATR